MNARRRRHSVAAVATILFPFAILCGSPSAATAQSAAPSVAYSFDEGTGATAADSSGNGLTGTLTNGATWGAGQYNSGVRLDGANDFVNLGNPPALQLTGSMTISAWISSSAFPPDDAAIVSKRSGNGFQLDTTLDGGPRTLGFKLTSSSGATMARRGATTLQPNVWYHVAGVYDAAAQTLNVYLNGQLNNGTLVGTVTSAQQNSTNNVQIGQRPGSPGSYNFAGTIDQVRIYNAALTAAQIQADMNTPIGGGADTTPPGAPGTLTASAVSSTQINLSWGAATDNVGVTGYRVERCAGTGCTSFTQVATPTGTSFSDTGLTASMSYSYRVRAVDAAGNLGAFSNTSTAATPAGSDTTPPSAPGTLTASAVSSSQIDLSWGAATDNVAVTGYRVERCAGTGCTSFAQIATPAGTSYSDTGLTASTSYSYRVRAVDAAGNPGAFSNTGSATTPAATATPGLVAAYSFDEGTSTTVVDRSGNANTGTIQGTVAWTTQGKNGGALTFNGTSTRVRVAPSTSLSPANALTLEAWVYPTATQSGWRAVMQKEVDAWLLHASHSGGALRPAAGGTYGGVSTFVGASSAIPVNAWTHLAQSYDGATLRLYVNGVQVSSAPRTGALQTTTLPLWIGGNNPYGEYFTGRIDDVRVYDRALSVSELTSDMNTPVGSGATPDSTPPSAPGTLTASAVSSTQINLSWGAATDNVGVTGYRVERCAGAGCTSFAQIATPTGTSFSDTGLTASTSYSYRVRAGDAAGNLGAFSNTSTAVTPAASDTTPPSAPGTLTASPASPTQIDLSWGAATDNVGVTGYRLERCQGTGCTSFTQIATPSGTTYSDLGLSASTGYSYRVRAQDAANNLGGYSNTAITVTQPPPDTTPPSAPGTLTASATSSSQIDLSWGAATDDVGVTGYRLERCQGASCTSFAQIATPTGTSFSDTALAASTSYSYRVRAVDAAGNPGAFSNTGSATTPAATAIPGLVAAYSFDEGTSTSVVDRSGNANTGTIQGTVAWTTIGKNGGALTFNGTSTRVRVAASTSLNPTNGVTLEAWVYPTASQSSWRAVIQKEVDAWLLHASHSGGALRPAAGGTYGGVGAFIGASSAIPVNAWTHLAQTYDGATIRLYVNGVLAGSVAQTGALQTTTSPLWIGGNNPYGEYFTGRIDDVRVYDRALSVSELTSDMNTPVGAGAAPDSTPPSAPGTLTASAASATQINLSWGAATDNVGVTGYRVERCSGVGCTSFAQVATPTGTSFSDTGLTASTSYSYRVRAVDAAGNLGAFSNTSTAATPAASDTTPPSAPGTLTASATSSTQVNLSWGAATDNVGVTGYRLERCEGAGCTSFAQIATPSGTTYSDLGLSVSTSYSYRVRAQDAANNLGGYSNTAITITPAGSDTTPPSAPGTLTASATSPTQINLSWGPATDNIGVTGYRVERCQGTGCTSFTQIATLSGTTYSDTGRTGATSYSYRVRATDAAGNLGAFSNIGSATTPAGTSTGTFQNEVLISGMNLPTALQFLPNGDMLVLELGGKIWLVPAGTTQVLATPFLSLTNIGGLNSQQGLMGMVLDPDFETNHYYYVFYTLGSPNRDRVSRFTVTEDHLGTVPGSEFVLYQDPENANAEHHGGALNFGADGKLYITTGEHFDPSVAQDLTSPRGKILRINSDGTVPPDNPFRDGSGPNREDVWALGLRNPFRAFYDGVSGRLYVADVGGNDYSTAVEEVHLGVAGANFGWPNCEGTSCGGNPAYTSPIYTYPHLGRDASITGGFIYRGSQFPAEYYGNYFFADYAQNWIKRLTFDAGGNVNGAFAFEPPDGSADGPYGDIVYLTEGPDAALYYVDLGFSDTTGETGISKIRRIRFIPGDLPPTAAAAGTPTDGPTAPLTVNFSSAGSVDPEGQPLTYLWDFGDGATSNAANPTHVYSQLGAYTAHVTVSDGTASATSAPVQITVGNKPVPAITSPSDNSFFRGGDSIAITGDASDVEDGALPASAFSWTVDFLHAGHVHPGVPTTGMTSLVFPIPTSGHDFSGDTRYRITLTVTDSNGLKASRSVTIYPDKVNLTFDTVPSGLIIEIDGLPHTTPYVHDTLINFNHTINAPNQSVGGMAQTFSSWSDGGAQQHTIGVPAVDRVYTATYTVSAPQPPPGLVAGYRLNEGAGSTTADISGNNATGTLVGAPTWTTGQYGGALDFNGTSYVDLGNPLPLRLTGSMTLSAWINISANPGDDGAIVAKLGSAGWQLKTSPDTGVRTAAIQISSNGSDSIQRYSASVLTVGNWYHVAGVYDAAARTLQVYVNGVLDNGVLSGPVPAAQFDASFNVNIAQRTGSPGGFNFRGRIDEVHVFNRALTASEIQTDMNLPR